MPPDGHTTVTINNSVTTKLTRIMVRHDRSSDAEAITYALIHPSFRRMKSPYMN
jgi:hypothetical protein